ncbi:hypothetical protein [Nonomuraea lactucae]|uniref:hypothetical protein n=1 Tax=Nonomuraea lactucae TaxID=2249762 RepID=UPI000DE20371|nr:hypothetical protein [Nonomuraea lactucae]
MTTLEESLSRFLDLPGVTTVALVDAVTGLTYSVVGEAGEMEDGIECAELTTLVTERLCEAGATGDLESVIVTTTSRYHALHVMRRQGEPLLITATLDRQRSNLALAVRSLTDHAEDVLA